MSLKQESKLEIKINGYICFIDNLKKISIFFNWSYSPGLFFSPREEISPFER